MRNFDSTKDKYFGKYGIFRSNVDNTNPASRIYYFDYQGYF